MLTRHRKPRSGVLLCSLALLLAMHPLSGSDGGRGEGLAALIRSLLCGCEVCSAQSAPLPTPSCCHQAPAPTDEDSVRSCPCSHPGDLSLPTPTPLCEGPDAGAGDAAASFVSHHAALSAATPLPFAEACFPGRYGEPPGARPPLRIVPGVGEALGIADGPRVRLAVLCTARK